jgi:hypothetical protein
MDRKMFTTIPQPEESRDRTAFAQHGGTFAVHPRQGIMISTEWGHPKIVQFGLQFDSENEDNCKSLRVELILSICFSVQQRVECLGY